MKAVRYSPRSPPAINSEGASSCAIAGSAETYMSESDGASVVPQRLTVGSAAHADPRALVRLIQCTQCSLLLDTPVTLPCGHSVCKGCLPQPHRRANVVHPSAPDRIQGIRCPVEGCGQEHPLGDCNIDVSLLKVIDAVQAVAASSLPLPEGTLRLVEVWNASDSKIPPSSIHEPPREQTSAGGRLIAAYAMLAAGRLAYRADLNYEDSPDAVEKHMQADVALMAELQESLCKELDCQVCYNLMYDPVTAPCGHTFCRICLARVLDHSMTCPICRKNLPIPPSLTSQPSNSRLVALMESLCPDMVKARAAAIAAEEQGGVGELDTPLFVCTLAFPGQPTFLHIFEPRYRLMIRRACESNRQFGMLMYNQSRQSQGELGQVHFKQYGVMLQILDVHMFPDGRSLIETRGMYRFKVLDHGVLDGYTVGRIQRVEDLSLVEEERIEAEEIASHSPTGAAQYADLDSQSALRMLSQASDQASSINCLTSRQLLSVGLDFVAKMQEHSAPWLHERILQSYGGPPNDPVLFPYWFASVIPIVEEEKYKLLHTSTIRERLKIVVRWILRIENQRW
ncbi:uncharacterized protein PV09_01167 [Verruconis gallopava]|uniref:RING-type domain-containing protein n=1 Tax=Verruconis gallopava TaxID=253628 RepID=A0A0D2BA98_9PEZI|nr:uncharacterized protein PV09_01167 [Verruconis gallopava]KIW08239.1 hypothetical protein PV09_01167 [Verruconis gallopava]